MTDFFYLLRCALWNVQPELDYVDDWNSVVRIAKEQTVLGLVGHSALQTEAKGQLLPESRHLLEHQVEMIAAFGKEANRLIVKLTAALSQEGIEAILLKGQGLAAFYPQPELRHCGDIDLLVKSADLIKAKEVINSLATPQAVQKAYTTEKHYHISIDGMDVELHWHCMSFERHAVELKYEKWEKRGLDMPTDDFYLVGRLISRPSATFNAFFVFLHLWMHFLERGIGMRQVCDWVMLLHGRNEQIDFELLHEQICDVGLLRPWQVFGCLAIGYLGLPAKEMPFYDSGYSRNAKRLLRIILKEGNFGTSMVLSQRHAHQKGFSRRFTTVLSIQLRSWRVFTILPQEGWRLWKNKMKGGIEK